LNERQATPRILVMEDSIALAMLLNEVLTRMGYAVAVATRVADGLDIARSELLAAAVLDINIAGERVYAVAAELARRDIPFLFASGYEVVDPAFSSCEILRKPYSIKHLVKSLGRMIPAPLAPAPITHREPDALILASEADPC
jgi:DNA-binding response OmpR family regulator